MSSLANRRRPKSFEDVYGNESQVAILQKLLQEPPETRSHIFVLTGVPGGAKTTLARLCASELCTDPEMDTMEVNGAAQNKKEDAEELVESIRSAPMSGGNRAIIYDEAHFTTPAAWALLLKPLEDCAKHNYWFICTSEGTKIPVAIKRRAKLIEVTPLNDSTMKRLLVRAAKEEKIALCPEIREKIIEVSGGSAGVALSHLETVAPLCKVEMSPEEIESATLVLRGVDQGSQDLAKALLALKSGDEIRQILKACKGAGKEPESTRRGVLGYCDALILGWGNTKERQRALEIIEVFCAGNTFDSGSAGLTLLALKASGE